MAFRLPNFNLAARIWRAGNPVTNPADVTCDANLALGRRVLTGIHGTEISAGSGGISPTILCPKLTDIRDNLMAGGPDTVECPSGTGRFYSVSSVNDMAKGFANEYRIATLEWLAAKPAPLP